MHDSSWLGPPVVPLYPFFGEGSLTKIDYPEKGYPYPFSNLSTGGPSCVPDEGQQWGIPNILACLAFVFPCMLLGRPFF